MDYLKEVICKIIGNEMLIDFELVYEIPLTPSGKFRVVTSKVPVDFTGQLNE